MSGWPFVKRWMTPSIWSEGKSSFRGKSPTLCADWRQPTIGRKSKKARKRMVWAAAGTNNYILMTQPNFFSSVVCMFAARVVLASLTATSWGLTQSPSSYSSLVAWFTSPCSSLTRPPGQTTTRSEDFWPPSTFGWLWAWPLCQMGHSHDLTPSFGDSCFPWALSTSFFSSFSSSRLVSRTHK